jgi:uncharacterized membrane protein SpoIIM required for sporulation
MGEPSLKSLEFRRERQKTWDALDKLVSKAEKKGLASLSARELTRLPVLYRATLSSLSVARAISLDRNAIEYLEALAGRAYVQVYATKRGVMSTAGRFLRETFPRAFRELKWHIALSAAVLLLGTVAGFFLTLTDLDRYYAFVDPAMAQGRDPTTAPEDLREGLYDTDENAADALVHFATFLATHNSQVAILAFALGFAAGIPTFYLLFTNGLILGAITALYHTRGLTVDVWGWLLPHGVTELFAIVICGGAGFALAQGLVFPGRRTRLASLAARGRDAAKVVIGAVCMLFVAGLIEGIFRQTVLAVPVRYLVAITSAVLWFLYFRYVGREREEPA